MKLCDTKDLMVSSDYKERFVAEYCQAVIRLKKLSAMADKYKDGTLEFTPTCPISTYDLQIKAMADYVAVLEARAVMENVELPVVTIE